METDWKFVSGFCLSVFAIWFLIEASGEAEGYVFTPTQYFYQGIVAMALSVGLMSYSKNILSAAKVYLALPIVIVSGTGIVILVERLPNLFFTMELLNVIIIALGTTTLSALGVIFGIWIISTIK